MTLAEQRKTEVLRLRDEGLAEDEIAEQIGISEDDVMRILDREEPPPIPYREPVITAKSKAVNKAFKKSTAPVKRSTALKVKRANDSGPGRHPVGFNNRAPAECGTESGHQRHRRLKEKACDPCKEVMRVKAVKRQHDARPAFETEEDCLIAVTKVKGRRIIWRCDTEECRSWHYKMPSQTQVSREARLARRRTVYARNKRAAVGSVLEKQS